MTRPEPYRNRREAGRILAEIVRDRIGTPADAVVLALPRGGVPVGLEVARELEATLDVLVVRKLGLPGHEEFAMGAIASGGFKLLSGSVIADLGITEAAIAAVVEREREELSRREQLYRDDRPAADVHGHTAILVDDGLATGSSMRAAIAAVRARRPGRLIVAVPVGAVETCEEIACEVDLLVCPLQPHSFHAVGLWYRDFTSTTDDEVRECLLAASREHASAQPHHPAPP